MLNYISTGDRSKPAVIFLHGFMGCAEDWHAVMNALAKDYFCLAVDLPGHGKSELPEIPQFQLIDYLIGSVHGLLDVLQLKQVFMVGYSMGGRLAFELIRANSNIFLGVVLESASPGIEDSASRKKRLRDDAKLAVKLEDSDFRQFLSDWYDQPVFKSIRKNTDLNKLIEKRLENDPLNLAKLLRGFSVAQQDPFWPKIKDLKLPFLYLAGSEDPGYVKLAKNISELNDKIEISVIADAGHNIHFEQPELYIQTIREFLHKHA